MTFGPTIRRALFDLIRHLEVPIVALGRVVDMIIGASDRIGTTAPGPDPVADAAKAVKAIRDAYAHVEERALGHVRRKPHPEALTIFDHRELVQNDRIVYGPHQVDLNSQLPTLLRTARVSSRRQRETGEDRVLTGLDRRRPIGLRTDIKRPANRASHGSLR
jgi:hypothetical protein